MKIEDIINDERKNVELKQGPDEQDTQKDKPGPDEQDTQKDKPGPDEQDTQKDTETLPISYLTSLAINIYDSVQQYIYKRFDSDFNSSLTDDEKKILSEPTEAVLSQYNIKVTPLTSLLFSLVFVNAIKIQELKSFKKIKEQEKQQEKQKE